MKKHALAYQKVNRILDLSKDFQAHRNNILNIQSSRRHCKQDTKRNEKIERLREQKQRYFYNAQAFKLNELQKDNNKIVSRLQNISKRDPKKLTKSNSHLTLGSVKSLNVTSSSRSLTSDFRRSESKRITHENLLLAERIIKAKPPKYLDRHLMKKDYNQQQRYVNSISRYSQKNKKGMTVLIKKGLRPDEQPVRFLPQLFKPDKRNSVTISFRR